MEEEEEEGTVGEEGETAGEEGTIPKGRSEGGHEGGSGDGAVKLDGSGSPVSGSMLKTSFAEECQDVVYPTLWQLGSGELSVDMLGHFYVASLSSLLSPSKVCATGLIVEFDITLGGGYEPPKKQVMS